MPDLLASGSRWLTAAGTLAAAAVLGWLAYRVLYAAVRRVTRSMESRLPLRGAFLRRSRGPLRLLLPVLSLRAAVPLVSETLEPDLLALLTGTLQFASVAAVAWLAIAALGAVEEAVASHYDVTAADNLKARKVVTQTRILKRIATAGVVIIAAGIILLQYEPVRELGTGLLASAGIVGIIFGIAAQQTLGNLIAGIQIAFTQPIRVDDVVIVQGEFGWIEEITLTYVVVRVWDRRRIVLPITHFVNEPFQNWTRTSADLIGAVYLQVDYRAPVDALREELQRVVQASEHWDGDVAGLQVTDTSERTMTLRALASAKNAPVLWDLRCEIREALVAFLQQHHPEALPTVRARVEPSELPDSDASADEGPVE